MASANFASRTIEITVISAENLQVRGKLMIKGDSFVTVRSNLLNDQISTKIDRDGAGFPRWNEKLVVDLPVHAGFFVVEVCRRSSSGRKIKIVGTARVPVADFTAGYLPESHLQFLSYRLRDERGERNGIVNLSVRVKMAAGIDDQVSLLQKQAGIGIPVLDRKFHGGCGGGVVVTGIPIWNFGYGNRF